VCYDRRHIGFVVPVESLDMRSDFCLVFALFGFLSPSNRGSIATVMMICWTFFGGYEIEFINWNAHSLMHWGHSVSGYIASRVYASLGGTEKRKLAFLTATILPT
jgi:transmembrane 9 superfamily member 2/4